MFRLNVIAGRCVLLSVVFCMVVIACRPAAAQRRRDTRRNVPPGMLDGMTTPRNVPQPEPVPADPDEAAPQADRQYKEMRLTPAQIKQFKGQQFEIRRILMNKQFEGNQDVFDDFIRKYFLGRWTLWENRTTLPGYRKELRNYFQQTKAGEVYDHLGKLVLEFMNGVLRDDYNLAARINAALAVGELNSAEPSGNDSAPPLPQALTPLIDAVNDAKTPDAVRAAAMVGVLRYAAYGIQNDDDRRRLTKSMLAIATADPPVGPSAAGREWIVAQAAETLGLLGSTGDGNNVFSALSGLVADSRFSDRTRSIAAQALGQLNYAGTAGINPPAEAAKIARFLADACADQMRRSTEAARPVPRRRIKLLLNVSLAALDGTDERHKGIMSSATQADQRELLGELHACIKKLSDLLDDRRNEDQDMGPPVDELRQGLDAWLKKQSGNAPKPAENTP